MIERKSPIHIREIIIALGIGLVMLVLGGIFDKNLSIAVYNPQDTSVYGIIFSGIAELPATVGLMFAACFLFIATRPLKRLYRVFADIFAAGSLGFGIYYTVDTWMNYATFSSTKEFNINHENFNPTVLILGIVFALAVFAGVALFTYFKTKHFDKAMMIRVSIWIIGFVVLILCLSFGTKILASRPRPNYLEPRHYDLYRNFWEGWEPFRYVKELLNDNGEIFGSFPSGHSTFAAAGMFIFPCLLLTSPKTANDRRLQIITFYASLAWSLTSSFSRVFAGAHFLSDVAAGNLVSIVCTLVLNFILFNRKSKTKPVEA